jgi:hypothetical protein
MYWIKLKHALLYGQPPITRDMLQPQAVKTAVREIARLVSCGWIDEPTEDMVKRIHTACNMGHCQEIWDELRSEKHPLLNTRKRRTKTRITKRRKRS